eukprot:2712445-Lingulodinium_polyedra.AAC.1
MDAPGPLNQAVSLECALSTPGPLHIIHNCAKSLLVAVPLYDQAVDALSDVCSLVRHRATRERLCERCFATPVG